MGTTERTAHSLERRHLGSMVVRRVLALPGTLPAAFSSAGAAAGGAGAIGSAGTGGAGGAAGAGASGSGTSILGAGFGAGAGGQPTGPAGHVGIAHGTGCGIGLYAGWHSGSTQYCMFAD